MLSFTDIPLEKYYVSQIFFWKKLCFTYFHLEKCNLSQISPWKMLSFTNIPLEKMLCFTDILLEKCYVSQIFSWKNVIFHRYSLGKMLSFLTYIVTLLTDHTLSISSVSHARCSFHFFPSQSNCCHHFPLHLVESHCTERS